jgi:hypothetical protein
MNVELGIHLFQLFNRQVAEAIPLRERRGLPVLHCLEYALGLRVDGVVGVDCLAGIEALLFLGVGLVDLDIDLGQRGRRSLTSKRCMIGFALSDSSFP